MLVKKADGSLEKFEGGKILRTCRRAGLSEESSKTVLQHVTQKSYDKIPTNVLMKIILKEMKKHDTSAFMKFNLRASLAELSPDGIFFEVYMKRLLEEYGYNVKHAQIARGNCSRHEIDLIAEKGNAKIMIECKHHRNQHTFAGLSDAMVTWAAFEDTKEKNRFTEAWLVCSTKISEHAIRYGQCKKLVMMGWANRLGDMIEDKKFYPVTVIESMRGNSVEKAFNLGVLTVQDVVNSDPGKLSKIFGENYQKAIAEAKAVLGD
ncbi:MAG: restriction endonuclease [Candidatus Aenigmarchaeota archaeon]|nr:restriction endonuclease [Candidatus Aenigmarchaeota archaeon]